MKRHRTLLSLATILGFFVFVSVLGRQSTPSAVNFAGADHHELSVALSRCPVSLAKTKSTIPSIVTWDGAFKDSASVLASQSILESSLSQTRDSEYSSRSLWLLNRSLLI